LHPKFAIDGLAGWQALLEIHDVRSHGRSPTYAGPSTIDSLSRSSWCDNCCSPTVRISQWIVNSKHLTSSCSERNPQRRRPRRKAGIYEILAMLVATIVQRRWFEQEPLSSRM
jgi:hypothetical protein